MALADAIRSGVAAGKRILDAGEMLVAVTHKPATGVDIGGFPTFGTAVTRQGVFSEKPRRVLQTDGNEVTSMSRVTFLEDVTVTLRDEMTINGTVRQILAVSKPVAESGAGYVTSVWFA